MVVVPERTHPTSAPVGPLVATLVACGLVVAGATAAVAPVAAATTTELSLVAQGDTTVEPGESVTYEVVVGEVDDGVGSYIVAVDVSDASVATITNASDRTGGASRIDVADDNSSVRIGAFAGDTTDDGTDVTIATVTVTGQSAGTADLELEPESVSDETGDPYTLADPFDAAITVGSDATPTPDERSPTASPTPTPATDDGTSPTDDASPTDADASPANPDGGDATPTTNAMPTDGARDDRDGGDGDGGDAGTTTGTPGFGASVAVLALVAAALVALRRRT